jgi:hypothetical protein
MWNGLSKLDKCFMSLPGFPGTYFSMTEKNLDGGVEVLEIAVPSVHAKTARVYLITYLLSMAI